VGIPETNVNDGQDFLTDRRAKDGRGGGAKVINVFCMLLQVTDDNDHTPQFAQPIYNVLFGENNVEGQNILKLNASDEDSGKNGAIQYTIVARNTSSSSSSSSLSIQQPDVDIDPVTGMVRALVVFDYEKRHVYEFVVTATDHGDSPRSSTALLRLEIMDANDESPVFTEATPYVFYIDENGPANYLIDMVSATDADSHPYNQITYSIEYDDVDTLSVGLFEVDAFTGRLYAKAPLDRERASQHTFKVIASNVGFPKVRTAADVIVYVNDENDNAPVVVFPSRYNRTLYVSPFAPQGTVVGRVDVRDPDFGYNGTLTFEVTNRPQQPLFDVNPTSGAILVVGDISAFDMHVFHLRILVTDNGMPPREAETDTELFITVNRSASVGGLAEAALMGGLLSIGQTEFVVILAVIVGILLTAVVIAIVTCCLRGRGQARDKRRCQRAFVGGGGGDRGETDKFLTTSLNGQSKAGDRYTIVVNANGKSDLLRAEEAVAMQRCRSDSDFAPNGSFYANNDVSMLTNY
jgi:protocadherin delta 1